MSDVLRVGVVGCGLIGQAVHLPNLAGLPERFAIAALADPSPTVGDAVAARYGLTSAHRSWEALLDAEAGLDALVVCSPHATHAAVILAALERGLHVFVEKPLCITVADAEAIARAATGAGKVVQVGYMKRYSPGYDAFLAALPSSAEGLRAVDVLTYDPWMARAPFVPWGRMVQGADIPAVVLARARAEEARQVGEAVGAEDPKSVRSFSYTFLACLVHDVNLIHGALDHLGIAAEPLRSAAWADGDAATATLRLPGGAEWRMTWLLLRGLMDFEERARLFFSDAIHELTFSVPYHVDVPIAHAMTTGVAGVHRRTVDLTVHDPFLAELEHFHACVTAGLTTRTPPEQSVADLRVLRDLYLRRS
ncbi:MAG: NADH-dependent dihydrogenase [Conexibacter sp.]|nr:NADH-dependent dihydrogenase [Conexibacter sp.]